MDRDPLVGQPREVSRVLWITFVLNEAVAIAKLVWGYSSGSVGMVSDGFHSILDGVSNIVGLIGIRIASAPPDKDHPYGHRKFESLLTAFVGFMIFGTCFEVLRNAFDALTGQSHVEVTTGSFMVMALTIMVNTFVMRYESWMGRKLKSDFLITDSRHTRSDLLTSAGVLTGLALTKLGLPMADALAGLVVAIFIARIGLDILKTSADVLVDKVQLDEEAVKHAVMSVKGVMGCHDIRSRGSQHHISIDLHLQLPPDMTLLNAHEKTHEVKRAIHKALPEVADIVLHTEPYTPNQNLH